MFNVVDGMICVPGGKDDTAYCGRLITKESFQNYRLTFVYKWEAKTFGDRKDKARDAGVLLHCIGANGPEPWMTSYEYQIIEGGTGDLLLVQQDDTGQPVNLACVAACEVRGNERYFKQDRPLCTFRNSGLLNWWGRSAEWKDIAGF